MKFNLKMLAAVGFVALGLVWLPAHPIASVLLFAATPLYLAWGLHEALEQPANVPPRTR